MTASPDRGPVGTRVHLEGDGFTDPGWQNVEIPGGYGVFLSAGLRLDWGVCDLVADTNFSIHIDHTGHLVAEFTIPEEGHCFQTDRAEAVREGVYTIGIACHACAAGTFRVTAAQ